MRMRDFCWLQSSWDTRIFVGITFGNNTLFSQWRTEKESLTLWQGKSSHYEIYKNIYYNKGLLSKEVDFTRALSHLGKGISPTPAPSRLPVSPKMGEAEKAIESLWRSQSRHTGQHKNWDSNITL